MERQRAMETIHTGIWHNKPPESKEAAKNLLSLALEDKLTYTCVNGGNGTLWTECGSRRKRLGILGWAWGACWILSA